jgi:hypothetical protein
MKVSSIPRGFDGKLRSVNGIFMLAQQFQKKKIPFELIGTNGSYRLIPEDDNQKRNKYFSKFRSGLGPKELGFVRKVKNYVMKNEIYLNFTEYMNPKMITYIDMKYVPDGVEYNDVYEIDIDEAYWRTALNKGVISEKLYTEGSKANDDQRLDPTEIKQRKLVRLIALGSLAKKSRKYTFTGKKMIVEEVYKSDSVQLTENIWYSICKTVSDIMLEAKKALPGDDYLFFWVDGIYFRGESNKGLVEDIFKKYNYNVKIKKIDKVEYINAVCHVHEADKEKPRTFNLPQKRKRKNSVSSLQKINKTALKYSK